MPHHSMLLWVTEALNQGSHTFIILHLAKHKGNLMSQAGTLGVRSQSLAEASNSINASDIAQSEHRLVPLHQRFGRVAEGQHSARHILFCCTVLALRWVYRLVLASTHCHPLLRAILRGARPQLMNRQFASVSQQTWGVDAFRVERKLVDSVLCADGSHRFSRLVAYDLILGCAGSQSSEDACGGFVADLPQDIGDLVPQKYGLSLYFQRCGQHCHSFLCRRRSAP
mmetsp:Transcript_64884/g.154952  ORF Transcript_64884/g.154952 Transcript_64884/m.154952 type:complete len:226 (-) Transcript_64884:186-863(-)